MRRRVLLVFPTSFDARQLAELPEEVRARYEIVFDEPRDDDVRWDFDVKGWLEARARRWRGELAGVMTSSDYPGALGAAALAAELGLPGAPLAAVFASAHKYTARQVAARVVPECTPAFALVDPEARSTWPRAYPVFVKPVRGSFSLFARRVENEAELARLFASPALAEYRAYALEPFRRFARHAGFAPPAELFLAEEVLTGNQVTLEGVVCAGRIEVLGIVDTLKHPQHASFARFEAPSALPDGVQARMIDLARRLVPALGLEHTLFNLELFHDAEHDRIGLIELNPRLCGQFADLYEKLAGRSGYEVALAVATGEPVPAPRLARFACAASVPLRTFTSTRVRTAPDAARRAAVEARYPGTLVWSECREGEELRVAADVEDGSSVRYGILNLGASSQSSLLEKATRIEFDLGFELESSS
jgi:biotin carboxylase